MYQLPLPQLYTPKFSSSQYALNASTSEASMTQAMRSWDSEMANLYHRGQHIFLGTKSRLIDTPSVSSPIATDTPPAPSHTRLISVVTSPRRNKRWILRSVRALPFWTSAPHVERDSTVCSLEEPVAPTTAHHGQFLPPSNTTTSPATGTSRRTWLRGAAPDNCCRFPMRFCYVARMVIFFYFTCSKADLVARKRSNHELLLG